MLQYVRINLPFGVRSYRFVTASPEAARRIRCLALRSSTDWGIIPHFQAQRIMLIMTQQ
jgi:hypothetical protein